MLRFSEINCLNSIPHISKTDLFSLNSSLPRWQESNFNTFSFLLLGCGAATVSLPRCDYDGASSSSIRPKPMRYWFMRWRPPQCVIVIHPRVRRMRRERITLESTAVVAMLAFEFPDLRPEGLNSG
jgi:hypothetical protein